MRKQRLHQRSAPAASVPGPAPTKIGVLNIQEAILASDEGKKEFDALQQKFNPKQAELKTQNDEVENLKKQLEAQGPKLNDDERAARARAIETKQKSLQRNFEDAQAEYQQAEGELANRIGAKMLTVLQKYSETHGYAVVLDVSNPQTSPVLWATQNDRDHQRAGGCLQCGKPRRRRTCRKTRGSRSQSAGCSGCQDQRSGHSDTEETIIVPRNHHKAARLGGLYFCSLRNIAPRLRCQSSLSEVGQDVRRNPA